MAAAQSADDVIVIGASVAGTVAAVLLARAGLRVRLLERRPEPFDKVCGEGILPAGLDILEPIFGPLEDIGVPFRGLHFSMAEAADLCWDFPRERTGLAVQRRELGRRLESVVSQEPRVTLEMGQAARGCQREDHAPAAWRVETANGVRRAPFVVAADGVSSRARRWAGLDHGPKRGRWGARLRFRTAGEGPERVLVRFLGRSEIYVTRVRDGLLSVAVLGEQEEILPLKSRGAFTALLERAGELPPGAEPEGAPRLLPHRGRRCVAWARDDCFLAGDAAIFLDPITGAGMTLAAIGGAHAATAILERRGGAPATAVARRYQRSLKRSLAPYVRLEKFLRVTGRSSLWRRGITPLLGRWPRVIEVLAAPILESRLPRQVQSLLTTPPSSGLHSKQAPCAR